MLLYHKPTCPYCIKVRSYADAQGIVFELKDITVNPAIAEELIARGGKRQVPYLVDDARGVEMYESADIVAYLQEHYAHKS